MIFARRILAQLITILLLSTALGTLPASAQSTGATNKAAKSKAAKSDPAPTGALIDLNSASVAELKTLPGIGDAYAAAIVKNRKYANKTQLKSRNVIPAGTYEKIKDKVIAKQ